MLSVAQSMWSLVQSKATTLPSDMNSSWCLTGKQLFRFGLVLLEVDVLTYIQILLALPCFR